MATYKLIQNIEAEDHILGPLTLRQFIFAMIAIFMFYICFLLVVKHLWFLLVLFLPPALFFAFFALPFGRDQPTEIWALAKLQFWFKPRRRIWNQSGVKELVTITVPKKIERVLTNGLSQTEVKSRLRVLADTIDSRGWAIKNMGTSAYASPLAGSDSDRLIDISSLPQEVPTDDAAAATDMMDETSSPIARQFETMITQSSQAHRQQLMDELNDVRQSPPTPAAPPSANWFMRQQTAPQAVPDAPMIIAPPTPVPAPLMTEADKAAEAELSASLAAKASSSHVPFGNLRTMRPLGSQPQASPTSDGPLSNPDPASSAQTAADDQTSPVTAPSDPAILSLANNNDLNVATLAHEARKNRGSDDQPRNEVVISLH